MANGVSAEKRTILNGSALVPVGVLVAILLTGANLAVQIGKWNASKAAREAEITAQIQRLNERHDLLLEEVKHLRNVEMELYDSRQRKIEIILRSNHPEE